MIQKYKYFLLLHFIVLIFGFTGILGKMIHVNAIAIVWYRVIIAFISLFIFMLILKRPFRVFSKKRLLAISFTGVIVGLHWITFFHSVQLSTASFGVLCLSTTTLHVSWLEPLVMKRKFSWLEFGLSLLVVVGIYFVSKDFSGDELTALFYGLSSALFAAIFAVYNAKFAEKTPPSTISFYEMGMASLSITILLLCTGQMNTETLSITTEDFWWLMFLGVVCTSFAFLITIEIVKYLGAFTVSLSINLEPVYTLILGVLILNENHVLDGTFYIGSVLIVGVIFLNAIFKAQIKKRQARQESAMKIQ